MYVFCIKTTLIIQVLIEIFPLLGGLDYELHAAKITPNCVSTLAYIDSESLISHHYDCYSWLQLPDATWRFQVTSSERIDIIKNT